MWQLLTRLYTDLYCIIYDLDRRYFRARRSLPTDARQVAEIGGWLVKYGSITHMDKELDKNMDLGHEFLDERAQLVEIKIQNPAARVQSAEDLKGSERVKVTETKRQGLKAPKKKFMVLSKFRKKFPSKKVDPSQIRTHVIDGEKFEGVDVISSEAGNLGYGLGDKSDDDR